MHDRLWAVDALVAQKLAAVGEIDVLMHREVGLVGDRVVDRAEERPVVLHQRHRDREERDAARDAGCAALIMKPFDLEALADALGRLTSVGLSAFEDARLSDTSPT